MAATKQTTNYGYAIYNPDDVTSWLVDFNGNWEKADAQFKEINDKIDEGGAGITIEQNTGTSTTSVMSQNAVTSQINTINNSIQANSTQIAAINDAINGVDATLTKINTGKGV